MTTLKYLGQKLLLLITTLMLLFLPYPLQETHSLKFFGRSGDDEKDENNAYVLTEIPLSFSRVLLNDPPWTNWFYTVRQMQIPTPSEANKFK